MTDSRQQGPVIIELDDAPDDSTVDPANAPPLPEPGPELPETTLVTTAAGWVGRRPSRLGRWFLGAAGAFGGLVVSVAAWNFVTALMASQPVLGYVAAALAGLLILVALLWALREAAGYIRLGRLDKIHKAATRALDHDNTAAAGRVVEQIVGLYRGRGDVAWALQNHQEARAHDLTAEDILTSAEQHVLAPLDQTAVREIEASARKVATVTALVPLALADVVAALTLNLRMIRTIAEIYGGRSGAIGNWRLTRQVLTHLVATGAIAVGDDLLEPLVGGGMLSKLSRRFGEGLVNGALTARVGLAAMDVCRPLPRIATKRPKVRALLAGALGGLFKSDAKAGDIAR